MRRFLAWFFQRKLNNNTQKLNDLQIKKKEILEKVMDNETYKVALSLLNRFGDAKPTAIRTATIAPILTVTNPSQSSMPLITPVKKLNTVKPQPSITTPLSRLNSSISNTEPTSNLRYRSATVSPRMFPVNRSPAQMQTFGWRAQQPMRPRTPFPIINQQYKGVLEKMVDYIIGDGPQNRFAMICKQCFGHNGMASEEQYEFMSFRCAYCNYLNPSIKSRPIGPKLPMCSTTSQDSITKLSDDSCTSTSADEKVSNLESEGEGSESGKEETRKEDMVEPILTDKIVLSKEEKGLISNEEGELKSDEDKKVD